MNKTELKNKFDEIQAKLKEAEDKKQDLTKLLTEKYNLLKEGFEKIKEATSDENFDKNPRKYSMLLSYVNSMKKIAEKINLPDEDVKFMEKELLSEMENNNLSWLLNN